MNEGMLVHNSVPFFDRKQEDIMLQSEKIKIRKRRFPMTKKKYLMILIAMCGMIATSLGLFVNIAGLFFNPIAEEFNIPRGTVSLTLTIANLVYAVAGLITPSLFKEKNMRSLLIVGTLMTAGVTAVQSLAPNIIVLYVCNAIRGFSAGMLGVVLATTIINNWYHANTGLATSIVMASSGIVGAIFSPVINAVISAAGWRIAYVVTGLIMVLFNLPAIFFVPSLRPETKGLKPLGSEKETVSQKTASVSSNQNHISIPLFIIAFLFALCACACTALPQHFPGIAESYAMSAAVGALMLSISMVANSGGKIIMGILVDRIGSKITMLLYSMLIILGLLSMLFLHNPAGMYIGAALVGLSYSMGTVGVVMISKDTFGIENYGRIYPKTSLGGTIGNALYSSIIGFMYDGTGNYTLTLVVTLIFILIVFIATLICYDRKNQLES